MLREDNDRLRVEWLVLRCQGGDRDAFSLLIELMERPLLYYATSLTGNHDAARDVLQEVWLKVIRGIRKLKNPGSLKPWLFSRFKRRSEKRGNSTDRIVWYPMVPSQSPPTRKLPLSHCRVNAYSEVWESQGGEQTKNWKNVFHLTSK
jgi:hypothetical protein